MLQRRLPVRHRRRVFKRGRSAAEVPARQRFLDGTEGAVTNVGHQGTRNSVSRWIGHLG